jgi:hypothetical protein
MDTARLFKEWPQHRRYGFSTIMKFWLAQTGRSRHWNRPKRRKAESANGERND